VRRVTHERASELVGVVLKWCISFTNDDILLSGYVQLSHSEDYFMSYVEEIIEKPYTGSLPLFH
jgi:hypothetical protein